MLFDYNDIKLKRNNENLSRKSSNIRELNNICLNNLWVKEEARWTNENKITFPYGSEQTNLQKDNS